MNLKSEGQRKTLITMRGRYPVHISFSIRTNVMCLLYCIDLLALEAMFSSQNIT